jgi:uncharacterized damage-inducible protein DinB
MNRQIIDEYARGGEDLTRAIAGLSPAELTAFPVPGTWSIHQIVIHLMDSDLIGADRMKRIIAEDGPLLIGYNETRFVTELHYHEQDINDAVRIFDLNRKLFASVLRKLPEAAFNRFGIHNEVGKVTLAEMVGKYVHHLEHHLKFVWEKRKKLGK